MTDTDGFNETPHPSSVADGIGDPTPPSVIRSGWYGWVKSPSVNGNLPHRHRTHVAAWRMVRSVVTGFPGDGYQDPQNGGPPETMDEDLDTGTTRMTEESAGSGPSSVKKHRKSARVQTLREKKDYTCKGSRAPSYGWSGALAPTL
jgi:hypothetical protein